MSSRIRKTAEERNAERRERYAKDPAYRQQQIESTRAGYRQRNVLVDQKSCLDNLDRFRDFGQWRTLEDGSKAHTFTVPEMAALLSRRPEVIARWIKREMFPEPVTRLREPWGAYELVYVAAEARHYAQVMGEHQRDTPYYRKDHDVTRARLWEG